MSLFAVNLETENPGIIKYTILNMDNVHLMRQNRPLAARRGDGDYDYDRRQDL